MNYLQYVKPTVLEMDKALPTTRTWLNHTLLHVHFTLHRPIGNPKWWNELPMDIRSGESLNIVEIVKLMVKTAKLL